MGKGGRSKNGIKSGVVRDTLRNQDVLDVFQDLIGSGGENIGMKFPKYRNIATQCTRFLKVLGLLTDSEVMTFFPEEREALGAFVNSLHAEFEATFRAPVLDGFLEVDGNPKENAPPVPDELRVQFLQFFEAATKSRLANCALMTCQNLVDNKAFIVDEKNLNDRFLTKASSMVFAPIEDLPQLNFKQIYIDMRLTPTHRQYLMVLLHKLFHITHDAYEALSAPDSNAADFTKVVMMALDKIESSPALHQCKDAFKIIRKSVGLLEDNYGDYHKESLASGNPSIMLESFVLDVKDQNKGNIRATNQFNTILKFYRKQMQDQKSNPKLQSLFQAVDKNFTELEKREKAAEERGTDALDSEESESGSDDAG